MESVTPTLRRPSLQEWETGRWDGGCRTDYSAFLGMWVPVGKVYCFGGTVHGHVYLEKDISVILLLGFYKTGSTWPRLACDLIYN